MSAETAFQPNQTLPEGYRPGIMEAMRGDDGRARTAVIGGVALVAAALVAGGMYLRGLLPGQEGVPDKSRISAKEIKLVPQDIECKSLDVYDTSGSTVRTQYEIQGRKLTFTGYGALIETGKVVTEACVEGSGVKITNDTRDGKPIKVVSIKVSEISFNTHTSNKDTKVVHRNPEVTKILGGLVDITSGVAEAACKGLAKIPASEITSEDCDKIAVISNWNDSNQASLDSALLAKAEDEVQKKCAKAGWKNGKKAFVDSYRLRADRQNADPKAVVVRFVDDKGLPTNDAPDFGRSTWDRLYADGTLSRKVLGTPDLEFSPTACTTLATYKPVYPD